MIDSKYVIWFKPSKWSAKKLIASLRRDLKNRVEKAYLIGSHAIDSATEDSDIDLILVHETKTSWPDRGRTFFDLIDKYGPMDLLVYTPKEWERLKKDPSDLILHAKKHWKKII